MQKAVSDRGPTVAGLVFVGDLAECSSTAGGPVLEEALPNAVRLPEVVPQGLDLAERGSNWSALLLLRVWQEFDRSTNAAVARQLEDPNLVDAAAPCHLGLLAGPGGGDGVILLSALLQDSTWSKGVEWVSAAAPAFLAGLRLGNECRCCLPTEGF